MNVGSDLAAMRARIDAILQSVSGFDGSDDIGLRGGLRLSGTPSAANEFGDLVASASDRREAALSPAKTDDLILKQARAAGVDPALVKAIVANESAFDPGATSATGAQGLMQLEPGTAAGLGVTDPYDPEQNLFGGARYIKGLLERFHGELPLAVAAYNAGPGAVAKYGGVPPYAETQHYVENVLDSFHRYKARFR